ncbi:hypothetical protein EVAR_69910_1 [Eumeta japonica]|uniref:Pre-C2HC domain-containing protein n=1 Tax=Eumeta variegata TaxID=151549 RepID=A0A4C2AAK4_EUMVA|nr:hypothetical protein EVAR_69910_1 [Eumeta japonica]
MKVKSTNHSDSSITSKKVTTAKIVAVASNKEATVSGVNTNKITNVALNLRRHGKKETEDIKADLKRQEYLVQAVHRIHCRDGTALSLVLVILNKTDRATDIFKNLVNVCGLYGVTVEAPYKRVIPGNFTATRPQTTTPHRGA